MTWARLPKARPLLASLSANPPARRYARGTFGPHDGAMIYAESDDRMKALRAIWKAEGARLLKLADQSGDYSTHRAHEIFTPQDAVAAAVVGANSQTKRAA